jgi:hypothetical protein
LALAALTLGKHKWDEELGGLVHIDIVAEIQPIGAHRASLQKHGQSRAQKFACDAHHI